MVKVTELKICKDLYYTSNNVEFTVDTDQDPEVDFPFILISDTGVVFFDSTILARAYGKFNGEPLKLYNLQGNEFNVHTNFVDDEVITDYGLIPVVDFQLDSESDSNYEIHTYGVTGIKFNIYTQDTQDIYSVIKFVTENKDGTGDKIYAIQQDPDTSNEYQSYHRNVYFYNDELLTKDQWYANCNGMIYTFRTKSIKATYKSKNHYLYLQGIYAKQGTGFLMNKFDGINMTLEWPTEINEMVEYTRSEVPEDVNWYITSNVLSQGLYIGSLIINDVNDPTAMIDDFTPNMMPTRFSSFNYFTHLTFVKMPQYTD